MASARRPPIADSSADPGFWDERCVENFVHRPWTLCRETPPFSRSESHVVACRATGVAIGAGRHLIQVILQARILHEQAGNAPALFDQGVFPARASFFRLISPLEQMSENQFHATLQFASYGFAQVFELLGHVFDVEIRWATSAQCANLLLSPSVIIGLVQRLRGLRYVPGAAHIYQTIV